MTGLRSRRWLFCAVLVAALATASAGAAAPAGGAASGLSWLAGGFALGLPAALLILYARRRGWRNPGRKLELADPQDRWLLAVRGINDGIWDADLLANEIFLSERCLEMLGFAAGEIRPSRSEWLARVHPEDEPRREADMRAHVAGQTGHYSTEFRMRAKDGSYRWILSRGQVLSDRRGRPVRAVGSHTDIHARKLAEQALREGEERYRALFEHSPLALLEHDYGAVEAWFAELRAAGVQDLADHLASHPSAAALVLEKARLAGVNEAAVRLVEAPSKAWLLANPGAILSADGARLQLGPLAALWRGGHETAGEFFVHRADGTMRRLHYRWWLPLAEGRPRYSGAQSVLLDVTESRAAEEALRASEERYRVLFEHSPVAIFECDYSKVGAWLERLRAAGVKDLAQYFEQHPGELDAAAHAVVVTGVNEETVRLLRASSRAHVREQIHRTFTPEVLAARRAGFLALWEGRTELEREIVLRAFDGTLLRAYYRWWVPRPQGRPNLAWTQVVLVDISDIKHAEAALAAERERLRVTLRSMNEGVITTDTAGLVHFVNEAAAAMTGWTAVAAIGHPIGEICELRNERTQTAVVLPFGAVLVAGRGMDLPAQTMIAHREGGFRLVEGRCAPMHDLHGDVMGAVLVFRDVTERARLEAEQLRSSKLESVGVLAGGIAHDFNNILTIVMGNLALAMLDEQVLSAAGKWLREAERGALRARDLTQQLLTFAKGGEPVRTAVSLPEVVQEAAQFALHGSKVKCECALAADAWPADADKGQIGQVVQNLVINAMQAMPEGGVIHITLRNDALAMGARPPLAEGNYVKISIADTGSGIRPEHLSRIFDPYFTTKQQGSGLGLATVYSIVRKHAGHIEVESSLGRGTTFRLWLPAARDAGAGAGGTSPPFAEMSGRVLFMDDEQPIRDMGEALLRRLGFDPVSVGDGAEAVSAYAQARSEGRPFAVVIMDLTVPGGMGGAEAMGLLRKLDPGVKAIVSSGYSSDPIMANYREHGFRGRVAKPYRISDLAKTLQRVLDEGATG